jgi:glutamate 5-kinase
VKTERSTVLKDVKRVVIKLGTRMITTGPYTLDNEAMNSLAEEIFALREKKKDVVIVSSGAIAAGMGKMGLENRPTTIPELQALAAIGQNLLMNAYERAMANCGIPIGQVLLTIDDIHDRKRYVHVRNTLNALLEMGVVPVINENDSVGTEEMKVGDNDNLSSHISSMVNADLLILFTDVDGLYDCDPRKGSGKVIPVVSQVTPEIMSLCGRPGDKASVGGMRTKLEAAARVLAGGGMVLVANGRKTTVTSLLKGEETGTLFHSHKKKLNSRRHWIATTARVRGSIEVDSGAAKAIFDRNASLLPKGIKKVEGMFEIGDVVSVLGPEGEEIARGVTQYSRTEIEKIMGIHSGQIDSVLGYSNGKTIIHRDELIRFSRTTGHPGESSTVEGYSDIQRTKN